MSLLYGLVFISLYVSRPSPMRNERTTYRSAPPEAVSPVESTLDSTNPRRSPRARSSFISERETFQDSPRGRSFSAESYPRPASSTSGYARDDSVAHNSRRAEWREVDGDRSANLDVSSRVLVPAYERAASRASSSAKEPYDVNPQDRESRSSEREDRFRSKVLALLDNFDKRLGGIEDNSAQLSGLKEDVERLTKRQDELERKEANRGVRKVLCNAESYASDSLRGTYVSPECIWLCSCSKANHSVDVLQLEGPTRGHAQRSRDHAPTASSTPTNSDVDAESDGKDELEASKPKRRLQYEEEDVTNELYGRKFLFVRIAHDGVCTTRIQKKLQAAPVRPSKATSASSSSKATR